MICDNCDHTREQHTRHPNNAFGVGKPHVGSCQADREQLLYASAPERCQCPQFKESNR